MHKLAQSTEKATQEAQNNLSRGDFVVATDCHGRELKRRVWEVGESLIYLCSEKLYSDLIGGLAIGWPIGFPKRDVRPA